MSESKIHIHEVGLRDGLQMEEETVPTETKLRWLRRIMESGLDMVQLGSFVHPRLVPQMADTDVLFRRAREIITGSHLVFSGLVLNEKGLERALDCSVEMICMGVSASETHSQKNTRMSTSEALERVLAMAKLAREESRRVQVSVQSAFGCGYEGAIPEKAVLRIVDQYLGAELMEISLADTAGHADPGRVRRLVRHVTRLEPRLALTCHFHNTYGLALANCSAAFEEGANGFESSFAGLGGCPFTAIAGGNVCTEDLLHMLQRMGFRKDIRIDVLITLAREVAEYLGRELPGSVYRTGPIPDGPRTPSES